MRSRLALPVVIIAGALGVAACGSSGTTTTTSNTGSTTGTPTTHTANLSPVDLMTIGAINAPGFSLPSIPVGAQVAINQLNAAGGLNGHPVKLVVCNDENNPNTATSCAREAIQKKVAAVVGGLSIFDLKIIPYLKQAGIAWVGPATPDDYTSSNLFLMGDEGTPAYVAIGTALADQGCKKIGIVISAEGTPAAGTQIAAGAKAAGATVVSTTQAPMTSPNWTSIVAAARSAGAQCIGSGTGPSETPGLVAAANSGTKFQHMAFLAGGLPDQLVAQLGASGNGLETISGYLPSTSPSVAKLRQEAAALAPKVTFDAFTEHGYASVMVVAQAAKHLSTITSSTLMQALPTVSGYNTGLGPIVNFAQAPPVAAFPRLFNPFYYIAVAKGGKVYLKSGPPINASAGLKLLASGK